MTHIVLALFLLSHIAMAAYVPIVQPNMGGTGATSLTANNVILGNGTSAVQFVAPGTSGNVLTSNGTTWTSASASAGGGGVWVGSLNYAGTSGCEWQRNNTTVANYSADTDCATPTVQNGTFVAVPSGSSKIPAIRVLGASAGSSGYVYRFEAKSRFKAISADLCAFRFSDGTDSSKVQDVQGDISVPVLAGVIEFSSSGDKEVNIQVGNTAGGGNCSVQADIAGKAELTIDVWRYPKLQ